MKSQTLICLVTFAFGAATANAQTMKPGLWEINSKMGGSAQMDQAMAKMQQQLASMPPAQRKMMEDAMAKQGMSMPGSGAGGGMLMKACISKEMAARNEMPIQRHGDCTTTTSDKTSSGMKVKFSCTNPPSSGEGQFTFSGDSAYTVKMNVTSDAPGAAKTTTIESSGKFLGTDCGNVKPVVMPKP